MNIDELRISIIEVKEAYRLSLNAIMRKYCDANNPHKIGDIFTDHIGAIKIQAIGYYLSEKAPCCIYRGVELKKDGKPRQNGAIREAFQNNEKR